MRNSKKEGVCLTLYALVFAVLCGFSEATKSLSAPIRSMRVAGNDTDLAYYETTLFIGNDRSPQSLILDTGSDFLIIPCEPLCSAENGHCGEHEHETYNLAESGQNEQATQQKTSLVACSAECDACVGDFCAFEVVSLQAYNQICNFFHNVFIEIPRGKLILRHYGAGLCFVE